MALTTSVDITSNTNYETLLNSLTIPQHRNLCYIREAKNVTKKKLLQADMILRLRKKLMSQGNSSSFYGPCSKKVVLMPTDPLVTSYPYQPQLLSRPLALNGWYPNQPSPSTFGGTVVQPISTTIIPQTFVQDNRNNVSDYINECNYPSELMYGVTEVANVKDTYYNREETATELEQTNVLNDKNINFANGEAQTDPLEMYLRLPKELFPTARMLTVDPNAIIDEFCKMPNLQRHAPWILDLEFGIPKTLVTRPLPIYNVKFNSIHCKNTPDAIHPTFEGCTPDFKRALLFYYDCVVSAWYKGYVMTTRDRSVDNFQAWVQQPMQALGMCWP